MLVDLPSARSTPLTQSLPVIFQEPGTDKAIYNHVIIYGFGRRALFLNLSKHSISIKESKAWEIFIYVHKTHLLKPLYSCSLIV